jgi:hypothetical protein
MLEIGPDRRCQFFAGKGVPGEKAYKDEDDCHEEPDRRSEMRKRLKI